MKKITHSYDGTSSSYCHHSMWKQRLRQITTQSTPLLHHRYTSATTSCNWWTTSCIKSHQLSNLTKPNIALKKVSLSQLH